ncbi:hypothetical protein AB0C47_07490 [Micromonospora taraxaci]|uniref:8-oxoguanine DNA glycosylase OGG fold protein n=1 Tax=Micromonospora taraxaci TaxID=1316803 RepID=UPI00340A322A
MIVMSNDCVPVPNRLRELLNRWDADGRQPQGGIGWNRSTWLANLTEHQDLLAELPDRLDRDHVAERGRRAGDGEDEAVQAFVTAMVWGYGRVGYGAFRTARVLRENDDAPRVLREVALRTRRVGGAEAFEWLKQHRLRYLGVSFATKYLFFCSDGEAAPALVLDGRVQRWLWRHAACHVSLDWNVEDYRRYLCLVTTWARELNLRPAEVEYLMFADDGSQQVTAQEVSGESDEFAVLDALDEAAAAFAALPGDIHPNDVDDFQLGVRQLRRIVLARGLAWWTPLE